jgi:hypothetical protein
MFLSACHYWQSLTSLCSTITFDLATSFGPTYGPSDHLYKNPKIYRFFFLIWHLEDRASWYILIIKPTRCTNFSKFILGIELYIFRTGFLSTIRSRTVYTEIGICHTGYADCLLVSRQHNLYDIYLLLCIQYKTPDDGQKTCPKHVEFYSQNKFEKLVHLVCFIIRI